MCPRGARYSVNDLVGRPVDLVTPLRWGHVTRLLLFLFTLRLIGPRIQGRWGAVGRAFGP